MTLFGGVIGLFLEYHLLLVLRAYLVGRQILSLSMIIAITASILLGIIAGAYPAYRQQI